MKWLDPISLPTLLIIALLLGLAPFKPEPHLWEKLKMLFSGDLIRPLDMLDLLLHGLPCMLLALKLARLKQLR